MSGGSAHLARLAAVPDWGWSGRDAKAVPEFLAPRRTIHDDPGDDRAGETLDRAGSRQRTIASRAVAPRLGFGPLRMLDDGGAMPVAWALAGTHPGDLPDLPASVRALPTTDARLHDFDAAYPLTGHWQIAARPGICRQITGPGQGM